jgi:hypothetical protein
MASDDAEKVVVTTQTTGRRAPPLLVLSPTRFYAETNIGSTVLVGVFTNKSLCSKQINCDYATLPATSSLYANVVTSIQPWQVTMRRI